jgi:glycosyltransferase involved in cell wall biosynthesis
MPKVLRIINRFNLGGPTYNAAYLSKYMPDKFETLLVGGMHDETEKSSDFILKNLNLSPIIIPEMKREINLKQDIIAYKKIKQLIKEFKPDIVHTHASKAGALGRLAASNLKVKGIVHTFHGHVFHSYFGKMKTSFYKTIERKLAKKSSNIIAISELQKKELVENYKICSADKVTVIPLGFDLDRFNIDTENKRNIFRNKWNVEDDEIAIGIIGRIVPVKDHEFFIDVIEKMISRTKKLLRFFIIGDGENKQKLIDYITNKNLSFTCETDKKAIITFTSWVTEVDVAIAGLDIVCLTSKNEGTPVSLIEAQSGYKPIVSTRVGGINDVVVENKSALLSEVNDLETYFNNLLKLSEDDKLRAEFSNNGNQIKDRFSYHKLIENMNELYCSILA